MTFSVSTALLSSRIVSQPPRDETLMRRIEAGQYPLPLPSVPANQIHDTLPKCLRHPTETRRQIRVYDRAKVKGRKRMMGGDGKLPNSIRHWFTEGERAVLTVIAAEVKRKGSCELSVLTIARLAGVGVRLVQYTIATARGGTDRKLRGASMRPNLINVEYRPIEGRRNRTNVITIISREWLAWLNYRPSEAPAIGCTEVRPIHNPRSLDLSHSAKTAKFTTFPMSQWAQEDESRCVPYWSRDQ